MQFFNDTEDAAERAALLKEQRRQARKKVAADGESLPDAIRTPLAAMPPKAQQAYHAIAANPGVQASRLIQELDASEPTVRRHLAELIKAGLIEHRGTRMTGGYYPVHDAADVADMRKCRDCIVIRKLGLNLDELFLQDGGQSMSMPQPAGPLPDEAGCRSLPLFAQILTALLEETAEQALRHLSAEYPDGCMTLLTPELAEKTISLLMQAPDNAAFTMSVSLPDEQALRGHIGEKVYMAAGGRPVDIMQCGTMPENFTLALADAAFGQGARELTDALAGDSGRQFMAGVMLKMANGCSIEELLADIRRTAGENNNENGKATPMGGAHPCILTI